MPHEHFPYIVDRGTTTDTTVDTSTVVFGDQYSHRMRKSINPNIDNYNVSFVNRPLAEITDIVDFFNRHGGVDWFTWDNPTTIPKGCPMGIDAEVRVVCKTWSLSNPVQGIVSLTTSFHRVYN